MLIFWSVVILLLMIAMAFVLVPILHHPGETVQANRWIAILLILLLPAVALSFYWQSGSYQSWMTEYTVQQQMRAVAQLRAQLDTPQQAIAALKKHLAQDPQSALGWYLLGRLYFSQEDFASAAQAFEKAKQYALTEKTEQKKLLEAIRYAQAALAEQRRGK